MRSTTPSTPTWTPPDTARLVAHARSVLTDAARANSAEETFRLAHLGALRTAAALFTVRARPIGRRRLVNAWVLLTRVAPEFEEWAAYFAAAATTRAAVEAGAVGAVDRRAADDQLRAAAEFLLTVEQSLGLLSPALAG